MVHADGEIARVTKLGDDARIFIPIGILALCDLLQLPRDYLQSHL
jgi:hypothetical protein